MEKNLRDNVNETLERATQDVLDEIDKMEAAGLFHSDEGDVDQREDAANELRGQVAAIKESQLTIAVCGAVKAGKSTFLNSLLFGREVLPALATPCTAKLTFITHSEQQDSFQVTFYDKDEYLAMKSRLSNEVRAKLEQSEKRSYEAGVSPMQLWGEKRNVATQRGQLDALRDFASEKGKFTPFVKEITLRINMPEIKNLYVVDTPGLDDPNPLNSLVTEKWASQAHAVIYLMPWRGMSAMDKKFLESNFGKMSEESANRVFVISKIDENPDWTSTMGKFKADFPNERDNVCGYSSYLVLLRKKRDAGESLDEDDLYKLENQGDSFNPDPGKVGELISRKLFNGGVKIRIDKIHQMIKARYDDYISACEQDIDEGEQTIQNLKLDGEKAKAATVKMRQLRERLQRDSEHYMQTAIAFLTNGDIATSQNESEAIFDEIDRLVRKARRQCEYDSDILPAICDARADIENTMKRHSADLFIQKKEEADDAFRKITGDMKIAVTQAGCDDYIRLPDSTRIIDEATRILSSIRFEVDYREIDNIIDPSLFVSSQTNSANAFSVFRDLAKKSNDAVKEKMDEFMRFCRKEITTYVSATLADVEKRLDELYAASSDDPAEIQRRLEETETKLSSLRERLKTAERMRANCPF